MERNVMSLDYPGLLAELRYESERLFERLRPLTSEQWDLPSPAAGWSIKDQVTHLGFFDDAAILALRYPLDFRIEADALIAGGMDFPDRIAEQHRTFDSDTVVNWFIDSRCELLDTLARDEPKRRVPWFGPDMSVASCATARLMETWAHGRDVYDGLHVEHPASPGLRSIAHLGVSTFAFSHALHGIDVPEEPVFIELRSATGELWRWGPADAVNRVYGPAEDFALTVTQRRHWTETALVAEGPVATRWLDIAQAFAGAPTRRAVPQ
jgi:uncharacterized protein (TIGR03084 family)